MSLVTNTSSALPYYPLPSAAQASTPVATIEALQNLSAGDQVSYVEANGTGSPPALLLPTQDGKGESLASVAPSGSAVTVTPAPADLLSFLAQTPRGSAADTPTATALGNWSSDLQAYYFDQKASGSPLALILPDGAGQALMAVSPSTGALSVSTAPDQFWADLYGTTYNRAKPQDLPASADFSGWGSNLQTYFFAQKATGSPPALRLSDGTGQALALLSPHGDSVEVLSAPDQFWADLDGTTFNGKAPQDPPTLEDFKGWSPALQAYYLEQKADGTPKAMLLPDLDASGQARGYSLASLASNDTVAIAAPPPDFATELFAPATGSKYDSATLEQFKGWPSNFQSYYIAQKGDGTLTFASATTPGTDGVRQASLSDDGSITYGSVLVLTDFWNTTTSAASAATALAAAQGITTGVFSTWPLASQLSYLQTNGSGSPPALLMPTTDGGHQLLTVLPGSNVVQSTTVPDQYLADLNGATYNTTPPDQPLTLSIFQSWANVLQTYFVANAAAAASGPVTLLDDGTSSDAGQQVTATLTSDGMGVSLTSAATVLQQASGLLQPSSTSSMVASSTFFGLAPDEQYAYYQAQLANATGDQAQVTGSTSALVSDPVDQALIGDPSTLMLGDVNGTVPALLDNGSPSATLTLTIQGTSFNVVFDPSRFAGLAGALTSPSSLSIAQFGLWPREIQSAFVAEMGQPSGSVYPKTLVLGGKALYLAAATADVDEVDLPSGFPEPLAGLDFSTFSAWPAAIQLAWLRRQPSSPVLLGTDPNAVQLALNTDGSGYQVAMASDLTTASVSDIDFALYAQVAPVIVQGQLLAAYADPGSSPPVITVTPTTGDYAGQKVVISGGSAATGGGLTIAPAPSNYGTAPAALTPAAFLAWTPAVQESYVLAHVSAASLPGTLVGGTSVVVPAFTIGSGVDVLSITFSQTDGTLQVSIPHTLSDVVTSGAATTTLAGTLLPYDYLPGSAVGTSSAVNDAVSAALYPILDGSGGASNITMSAQQELDFALQPLALSGATFAGWPSALQLQYLRAHQSPGTPLTIGSGTDTLDALMQTTPVSGAVPKVYIVQNLQKNDIGMMSYADQATLAKSKAFTAIANGLGLIPDDGTTAALTGNDVPDPEAGLTTASTTTATLSAFGFVQTMFVTALNTIDHPTLVAAGALPNGNMPAADRQVFEAEVNLLRQQTFGSPVPTSQQNQSGGQAIFSPKDIQDKLTAIIQRFTRANAFSQTVNGTASGHYVIDGLFGQETSRAVPTYFYNSEGAAVQDVDDFNDNWFHLSSGNPGAGMSSQAFFNNVVASGSLDVNSSTPQVFTIPASAASGLTVTASDGTGSTFVPTTVVITQMPANWNGDYGKDDSWNGFQVPDALGQIHTFSITTIQGNQYAQNSSTPTPVYAQRYTSAVGYQDTLQNGFSAWTNNDNGKSIIDYLTKNDPGLVSQLSDGQQHVINIPNGLAYNTSNNAVDFTQVVIRFVNTQTGSSTDNNATIKSGYQTFMAQEKSVLDLANRANQLATSGRIGGTQQNLDVPNLVYLFMMYTNLTGEAVLRADTEEVNQTNAVLNEYATMQKIINQTVASIKPGDDGKPGSGTLQGSGPNGTFTDADNAVLAMFQHGAPVGTGQSGDPPRSPIELMQTAFTRPYLTNGVGVSVSSSQWSSDGTSLSDAVTQLNQASQLKMNDINSETKQKDREFDLANTALQKMSDMVSKIAAAM